MIIAVNGVLIDTKNIYAVTPIRVKSNVICFDIISFNEKIITVEKHTGVEKWWRLNELLEKEYTAILKLKEDLEDFRQAILNIWSNNQSEIPQFNIINELPKHEEYFDGEG